MTYPFKTRDGYLQYRADWKRYYATLSAEIRECKAWLREEARLATKVHQPNATSHYHLLTHSQYLQAIDALIPADKRAWILEIRKRHQTSMGPYSPWFVWRKLAATATTLLDELKLAKIEAQRQYTEFKAKISENALS